MSPSDYLSFVNSECMTLRNKYLLPMKGTIVSFLPPGTSIGEVFRIDGSTAVVTGASRGIGLAISEALALGGADVIAVSSTPLPPNSSVQQVVEQAGQSFTNLSANLSDSHQVKELAEQLQGRGVDVLINNGGAIRRTPAASHSDADFDYVMQVNLRAPWVLSRELGLEMIARGRGKIVNTASMLSFQGGINVPGYTSSKSALAGLTKALANEWASYGVNVNAIAPGYIATDNTAALRADEVRSAEILGRIPAGRWGKPADIAATALFLCSPASDYINGAIIPVDGGWLAR